MTILRSIAALSFFSTSLVVACGGSSQNPSGAIDAGGASPDSGSPTLDSGVTDAAVDAGPACTTSMDCATGENCCLSSAAGGHCITGMCQGASVGCTTTGDCTGGQVCCGTITGTASGASACQAAPCASGAYELCTPGSSQCPTGDTCNQPVAVLPLGYCVATPDGGGAADGGDAGSEVDSGGADSASDATGE